jgi:mannosyltransferase
VRAGRGDIAAVAGFTLLAAALRFSTLHVQSFELDEAVTVGLLRHDLWGMLGQIPHSESTPPLYYLLAWPWAKVLGTGEAGLRSLSALFGTATVPVAYLAGRELVSSRSGLVVAALAATNPLLVWEGQEARSYALLVLTAGLSLVYFARILRREARVGDLALWAATSALALLTHYFAAFLALPEAVWLALAHRSRLREIGAAAGGVALVGAALVPLAVEQRGHRGAEALIRDSGSLGLRLRQLPKQFLVGFDAPAETVLAVVAAAICAGAVVLLLTRGSREERGQAVVPAVLAAAAVAVPLLLALAGFDYFNARNSLAAWLPAATVVGAGLAVRGAARLGVAGAAALALLGVVVAVGVATDARYQRDDWRGAAEALGSPSVPRAVVFAPAETAALQLYLRGSKSPPAAGAAVREIDFLVMARHRAGEERAAPRLRELPPPPPGGRTLERRREQTFALVRYRLARPVRVVSGVFPPLAERKPSVLVQDPR